MSSTRRRSFESVLAVIGVSIPFLVYFSAPRFADEMRDPYTMTVRYGLNPITIVMGNIKDCLLSTSPSPRARTRSRMPSSA